MAEYDPQTGSWFDPLVQGAQGAADLLTQPGLNTAAMQFALNLGSGGQWGDTGFDRFARAVGGAGEAIGRREKMDVAERDITRKEQVAQAQSDAAAQRAINAEQNLYWRGREVQNKEQLTALQRDRWQRHYDQLDDRYKRQLDQIDRKLDLATTAEDRRALDLERKRIEGQQKFELGQARNSAFQQGIDIKGQAEERRGREGGLRGKIQLENLFRKEQERVQNLHKQIREGTEPQAVKDRLIKMNPIPQTIQELPQHLKDLYVGGMGIDPESVQAPPPSGTVPGAGGGGPAVAPTPGGGAGGGTPQPGPIPIASQRVHGQTYGPFPNGKYMKWDSTRQLWVNP